MPPTEAVRLDVGSPDPHGLRLDDDRAPRSRRRPTAPTRKMSVFSTAATCVAAKRGQWVGGKG